jgi:hypothetical protein
MATGYYFSRHERFLASIEQKANSQLCGKPVAGANGTKEHILLLVIMI